MELEARIATLRRHPGFRRATRAMARSLSQIPQGAPLLKTLMDDRGRMLFSHLALHCHYSRDDDPSSGLTPTRMKQLCVELDVCSPGRVTAMLALMRLGGYLAPDPDASDRRRRRLVATPRLERLLRERWRANFSAAALLFADGERLMGRLDEEAFVRALVAAMFGRFRAGFRLLQHTPELRLFGDRNAGMLVLSKLVADAGDDASPIAISISELSRRFGASRVHLAKMIRDAVAEGLLARAGDEAITLTPALWDAVEMFFANAFLFFFDSLREAARSVGIEPSGDGAAVGQRSG